MFILIPDNNCARSVTSANLGGPQDSLRAGTSRAYLTLHWRLTIRGTGKEWASAWSSASNRELLSLGCGPIVVHDLLG